MPRRSSALAALLFLTSLLSCGREITGPSGGRFYGSVAFAPHFESANPAQGDHALSVASLVPFTQVRILITRGGAPVLSRVVDFSPTADSVALQVAIPLGSSSSEGEQFEASLQYINAAGDTVFRGGPLSVLVLPGATGNPTAIEMPLTYVGPGASAVTVTLSPDSILATSGQLAALTAVARDAQNAVVAGAVIGFSSRNPTIVTIPNTGVASAQLVGARGSTWVIGELINGASDSTHITIDPRPSSMILESGNGQFTLQGTAFAQPLRVRVRASDNLGVAGWPVNFAVTSGQGSLDSLLVHTDANGFAQVNWTAGDSAGVATVTASIPAPALNIVFTGTQQSSGPTALSFEAQPSAITAGEALPNLGVAVRNGANAVITSFTGPVELSLTGGTAGALLVGDTLVNAVNGIATFSGLSVNRGGTNYRLVATVAGAPSALSNTFNVANAPPAATVLIGGGGQSGAASAPLTDSIKVRVTDIFGFPVPGLTVNFAVTQGSGSVSPASAITNADGRAATQWTLGATGPQQISATAAPLSPLNISATVIGGGGPASLFAGYDYTFIAAGRTRTIPLFLSAPAGSPTTVLLTSSNASILAWQSASVEIPAGVTSIGVPLDGGDPGAAWAVFTSALGSDSVLVTVDSSQIVFEVPESSVIALGDTARVVIRISDPAPAGGVTLTVRTVDSTFFAVAAGSGRGAPTPGCVAGVLCDGGDLRAEGEQPLIIGVPGGTASIFIPEGAVAGNVVVLPLPTISGSASTNITATAPGYVTDTLEISAQESQMFLGQSGGVPLYEPIGEGQRTQGVLQRTVYSSTRELVATLTSRDEEAFTVDSIARIPRGEPYSIPFTLKAYVAGSAYLVVEADGFAPDSVLITVAPPVLDVEADGGAALPVHESSFLRIRTAATPNSYIFPLHTAVPVTIRVSADSVIELDATSSMLIAGEYERAIAFRVIGPGDSYIIVDAPAHASDSVHITTVSAAVQLNSTPPSVGVGSFATVLIGLPGNLRARGPQTITVTSLNPAVARVLTPTVVITPGDFNTQVQIEAVDVGDATIRLTGPDLALTDFNFNAYTPGLTLSGVAGTWDADSVIRSVAAFSFDGGTGARAVADTVVAKLRSSNPAVAEVTDSVVTFAAGESFSLDGKWRAVAPGSADLTLHAPNYTTSDPSTVVVLPYALDATSVSSNIGRGLRSYVGITRMSSTSAALPYVITQTGPGSVGIPLGSDTLPAGMATLWIQISGVTLGIDTLIFSAAGHASDTVIVQVVPPEVSLEVSVDPPMVGFTDLGVGAFLTHSGNPGGTPPDAEARFVLTSTDSLKARVEQDTIIIPAGSSGPTQSARVKYVGSGNVTLIATPVGGLFPADTLALFVDPATIFGISSSVDGALVLGMGQKTAEFEVIVGPFLPLVDPMVIHLQSSDPTIVTVPDSIVLFPFQPYESLQITAGDSVGSTRITASSPGWNEFEMDVVVTRGETVVLQSSTYVGQSGYATVYVRDALTRTAHALAAPMPMRLTSDRPDIASTDPAGFEYPAGVFPFVALAGATGVSPGQTLISAEDTLSASDFRKMLSEPALIDVYPARMYVTADRHLVGLGLRTESARNVYLYGLQDSVWVHFSSLGGKFTTLADSLLVLRPPGFPYGERQFDLVGLVAGTDTLVLSADGFGDDTMIVVVQPGVLHHVTGITAPTVVAGDSTLVTLQLRDASGAAAAAHTSLVLNFSIESMFEVTDGASTITAITIDPGDETVSFWVKAVEPGTAELTVTSPNFVTFRYVFTTRPIP